MERGLITSPGTPYVEPQDLRNSCSRRVLRLGANGPESCADYTQQQQKTMWTWAGGLCGLRASAFVYTIP